MDLKEVLTQRQYNQFTWFKKCRETLSHMLERDLPRGRECDRHYWHRHVFHFSCSDEKESTCCRNIFEENTFIIRYFAN